MSVSSVLCFPRTSHWTLLASDSLPVDYYRFLLAVLWLVVHTVEFYCTHMFFNHIRTYYLKSVYTLSLAGKHTRGTYNKKMKLCIRSKYRWYHKNWNKFYHTVCTSIILDSKLSLLNTQGPWASKMIGINIIHWAHAPNRYKTFTPKNTNACIR